jgi:hypothetical protein
MYACIYIYIYSMRNKTKRNLNLGNALSIGSLRTRPTNAESPTWCWHGYGGNLWVSISKSWNLAIFATTKNPERQMLTLCPMSSIITLDLERMDCSTVSTRLLCPKATDRTFMLMSPCLQSYSYLFADVLRLKGAHSIGCSMVRCAALHRCTVHRCLDRFRKMQSLRASTLTGFAECSPPRASTLTGFAECRALAPQAHSAKARKTDLQPGANLESWISSNYICN